MIPPPSFRLMIAAGARSRLATILASNLALLGTVAAAMIVISLSLIVHKGFGALEEAEMQRNVDRVDSVLSQILADNSAHSKDWGMWDDTFFYLKDFNPKYESANIHAESFRNAQVDCMAFVRFDRAGARTFCFAPLPDAANARLTADFAREATSQPFRRWAAAAASGVSFMRLDDTVFAVAATQILRSDRSGKTEGYIVFLQRVSAKTITQALQVPGRFEFGGLSRTVGTTLAGDHIAMSIPVLDARKAPVATVRFDMPRSLMAAGTRLRNLALVAVILMLVILLGFLWLRLRQIVSAPIRALHEHVESIRKTGELSQFDGPVRDDEIGELQDEFNRMARELLALRAQNEAQSFALGKSQSAIGVMHNVRNSLSPVNVILATLEQRLAATIPDNASRAIAELADPGTDRVRRGKLAAYLAAVHEELASSAEQCRTFTREAGRNLSAALDTISSSQQPEKVNYEEACELGMLAGHAANAARFVEGADVSVAVHCPERLVARGNRVLLNQVFENIVINATEAIKARGLGKGALAIAIGPADRDGWVRVSFKDDGEGFAPSDETRLFERGFSTRLGKNGGMGLHWCANTINAMKGSLRLTSPGTGMGATATIELPMIDTAASKGCEAA